MQSILVASDLSVRSDRAAARAARMARRLGARLTALHVVDSAMPLALAETVATEARAALETFLASCDSDPAQADIRVVIGDPAREIDQAADDAGADLLVLGLHRERGFLDLLKETTMERIVRSSAVPVLLVADAADHDYRTLLCAVDMSPASAKAIRAAQALAPEAQLTLFHAYHVPYRRMVSPDDAAAVTLPFRHEAEQAFAAWVRGQDLPADLPRPDYIDASPSIALDRMLARQRADLLVLGAHSRSNLGRYMLGGFAAGLVRKPPCDLLVAK